MKTKIVCSLGPASDSDEVLARMIRGGMNVARINFSHGSYDDHKRRMDAVKRISKELDIPVAIMLDTKGPEIRTGLVRGAGDSEGPGLVEFKKGDTVLVSSDGSPTIPPVNGQPGRISLSWTDVARRVKSGVRIRIADGLLELLVESSDGTTVTTKVLNGASIGSRKNVNLLGIHAGLPILGPDDKNDIAFGAKEDIDFVAASFLSFPHEITEIREYLRSLDCRAKIIAKIESAEGVENIEQIIKTGDGVMVARGDLAVQIPDEKIPLVQKRIITLARNYSRPVITATQMLDSMIVNPRPTRAELTDVANAIFDGTDAVMLSGETAAGAYPAESVETMARIAAEVEESAEYRERMRASRPSAEAGSVAEIIARAAYDTALKADARIIITPTLSGNTARLIAKYRCEQPILAVTPEIRSLRSMLLDWGVFPHLSADARDSDEMIANARTIALKTGLARISDRMVLAAGLPIESPQPLNTVRLLVMGTVLSRGRQGGAAKPDCNRVSASIIRAESGSEALEKTSKKKNQILVCPSLDESYADALKNVAGIICEGAMCLSEEKLYALNSGLVWISALHNAGHSLEEGLSVTVDGSSFLVYEGLYSPPDRSSAQTTDAAPQA